MDGSPTSCCGLKGQKLPKRRIVIVGQTGVGKSSLGNKIFKGDKFTVSHDPDSGRRICETKTKCIGGKEITLIDLPGLCDPEKDEKELKPALFKCITECSPGPHVFLIVLNIQEYIEKGKDISKLHEYLSEDVFKHAIVVFTHGNSLPKSQRAKDFVKTNTYLNDLVEKCGNRCHVVDNKHWSKRSKYRYRSNKYQVKKLLESIEMTVEANGGSCYTNDMLQEIEKNIEQEEKQIKESSRNLPEEKIREAAKDKVHEDVCNKGSDVTARDLLGVILGVTFISVLFALRSKASKFLTVAVNALSGTAAKAIETVTKAAVDTAGVAAKEDTTQGSGKPTEVEKETIKEEGKGSEVTRVFLEAAATIAGINPTAITTTVAVGAALGNLLWSYEGAEKTETPWEAAGKAIESVTSSGGTFLETSQNLMSNLVNTVSKSLTKDT